MKFKVKHKVHLKYDFYFSCYFFLLQIWDLIIFWNYIELKENLIIFERIYIFLPLHFLEWSVGVNDSIQLIVILELFLQPKLDIFRGVYGYGPGDTKSLDTPVS